MSLESWGIHTFEGWRGADDSLIIRYSENVHFPNSSPHHRGESWWVSHLALRCAQGEVQAPAGTQSFGLWRAPFPPFAWPPPRIFPVPLTETKILSSVTYGCIINEIRICIVLRTCDGVCVFLRWGGQRECTHTQTYTGSLSRTHARTRHFSTSDEQTCVWCCAWQSVRQYRKLHLASPFMSPLLLRYIVTANMKSGLFCQKCVNKHGNTSSEGHNSILHDKCSESAVAFRFSHKITEQTKVGCHRL